MLKNQFKKKKKFQQNKADKVRSQLKKLSKNQKFQKADNKQAKEVENKSKSLKNQWLLFLQLLRQNKWLKLKAQENLPWDQVKDSLMRHLQTKAFQLLCTMKWKAVLLTISRCSLVWHWVYSAFCLWWVPPVKYDHSW